MASLTDRISLAPKPLFLVIGAVLGAAVYFSSGGSTTMTQVEAEITKTKQELKKKSDVLQKTQERLKERGKFEEEMSFVSQTFRQALDYLPTKSDTQDLLKKIYSEARTAGVELTNFKPKETISKDFYDEIPMDIQVRGTYSQLTGFLGNVSKIPRIINIRNVEIRNPKMKDGMAFEDMIGTLVAYRYKEGK